MLIILIQNNGIPQTALLTADIKAEIDFYNVTTLIRFDFRSIKSFLLGQVQLEVF